MKSRLLYRFTDPIEKEINSSNGENNACYFFSEWNFDTAW